MNKNLKIFSSILGELKEKIFSSKSPEKQKLWLGTVLLIVSLGIIIPFHQVYAILEPLADFIANAIAYTLTYTFLYVGNAIVQLSIVVLNFILSENFITWSYTGLDNPIVNTGWTLTRDLTNMGFVIILVYIGLSTALRLGDQNAKKALPTLILIALLINFTPVILGVVVDASNIIMNFFLGKLDGLHLVGTALDSQRLVITETLKRGGVILSMGSAVFETIMLVVFDLLMAVVIFLFAAIFAMRYVAIWILVILSPLAFAAYILPSTRSTYNQWWRQFTQWCIIGIVCAFFLYLGNHILVQAPKIIGAAPSAQWWEFVLPVELVRNLMPYGIALSFLVFGFFFSLSTSAMGASGIISAVQKGVRTTGKLSRQFAERRAVGPAAGTAAKGIGAAAAWTRRLEEKGGVLGTVIKPLRWATRGAEMAAVPALTEYAAKQRRVSLPAGWKQMSITEKQQYVSALFSNSDRLVLASEMKDEGTFQKTTGDFKDNLLKIAAKFKKDIRYKKEVGDILDALPNKVTKEIELEYQLAGVKDPKAMIKIRTDFRDDLNRVMAEFGLTPGNLADENKATAILHMRGFKPKDLADVDKSSEFGLKSEAFQLAMRKMSSAHLQALLNNLDEGTVRDILEENRGLNNLTGFTLAEFRRAKIENPKLVRWAFETPAGREMLNWSARFTRTAPPPTPPPAPPPTGAPGPGPGPAAPPTPPTGFPGPGVAGPTSLGGRRPRGFQGPGVAQPTQPGGRPRRPRRGFPGPGVVGPSGT